MTARTAAASTRSDALSTVRRWLALHRRMVSAALAFVAVLLGLSALTRTPEQLAPRGPGTSARSAPSDGQLAVPIRLSDPAVAEMLAPGDVVDVMVADQRGAATVVASELIVTAVPGDDASGPWSDGDGLVMVAADADTALTLAGAAARGLVTVAVRP